MAKLVGRGNMPIREYSCEECGNNHDTLVRTDEDIPKECPGCGSERLKQVITAMGGIKGYFGTVPRKGAGSFRKPRK